MISGIVLGRVTFDTLKPIMALLNLSSLRKVTKTCLHTSKDDKIVYWTAM